MKKNYKKLFISVLLIASFIPVFNVHSASPVPMGGLDLWLEADSGVTLTNGCVSSWESKVNGIDTHSPHILNQVGNESTTKPVLITDDNGRKSVYFNMNSLGTEVERYKGEITVFCVSKSRAMPSNYPSYLWDIGSMFTVLKKDGTYNVGTTSSGFSGGASVTDNYSVLCTVSCKYGEYRRVYSYQNNKKVQGPFGTNGTNRNGYDSISRYKLGRYSNDEIAAVLVYRSALSSTEMTQVYNYLYNKYMSHDINTDVRGTICNNKIILSSDSIFDGEVSSDDFVIRQNNNEIPVDDAYISEYGTVVLECNAISDNSLANVVYTGNNLTNIYGDNTGEFDIQTDKADFEWLNVNEYNYDDWGFDEALNDGEAFRLGRSDTIINNSPVTGEQTGFFVLKINNIQSNDTLFGDNLYLNSVALSSRKLSDSSKVIEYVRENKWYVISYMIKENEGSYALTMNINGKQVLVNEPLSEPFVIDSIGGSDFSLKTLYITDYAMDEVGFYVIDRNLVKDNVYYTSQINGISYDVTDDKLTATLNCDIPAEEQITLITAIKGYDQRLINLKTDKVTGGMNKTFTTSVDISEDAGELSMYMWIDGELIPVAEKEIFRIREIDASEAASSYPAENSKEIPEFISSLPDSYLLTLNKYDDEAVNYLNAKGFLPDNFTYSANSKISESDFVSILNKAAGSSLTGNGTTITTKQALVHIYNILNPRHKAYINSIAGGLSSSLSDIEKKAATNALEYGITSTMEIYFNSKLTYSKACKMLADIIIKAQLYENGSGADIPYTMIHSRYAKYSGSKIKSESNINSSLNPDNIAFEAMDKECVNIGKEDDYIEFENVPDADKLTICYSIPRDTKCEIDIYVNDVKRDTVELSTKPLYRASDTYNYMNYFAEKITDLKVNGGDRIKLVAKDGKIPASDGFSSGININYIKLEDIGDIKSKPAGYISAESFGAYGDDICDDTNALQKAIDYAYKMNAGLYIPSGTYYTGKTLNIPSSVRISGAGMWYTVLECGNTAGGRAGFNINGNDIVVEDLKIQATDNTARNGSGGAFRGKGNRILIKNVWMMNTNTGMWTTLYDSVVESCRITDTVADGIHFAGTSENNVVRNCIITGCGDDGIGTSSSVTSGIVANNIKAVNNTIERIYWGRGIMYSGNQGSLIEGNVISDVLRNPGILIWTEANYDTLSAYNIIIKNNVLSECRRNTGKHRGAITLHNNRSNTSFWVDADIYDNEVYQNGFSYCIYIADSDNGLVYCESKNNIFSHTPGSMISEKSSTCTGTVIVNEDNLTVVN